MDFELIFVGGKPIKIVDFWLKNSNNVENFWTYFSIITKLKIDKYNNSYEIYWY